MKEKFRNWIPKGITKWNYVAGDGSTKCFQKDAETLSNQIVAIVNDYSQKRLKLTNRQLYYQLVAGDIIPNADKIYKSICTFLTKMRYAGLLDWDAIEDRGRVPSKHSEWANVKSLVDSAVRSYRKNRWKGQNHYVELFCEKQAMESILKPVADDWHIYFGYNKGYSSASSIYDLAQRVKRQIEAGKEAIILYLGDHDASGLDMVRDIKDRVYEFLTAGQDNVPPKFKVIQLALNMEQIKQYNPPPNPAKLSDSRAKKYIAEFGNMSWELDALKPEVLQQIAEEGILEFIDEHKYDRIVDEERDEVEKLRDYADTLVGDE